MMTWEEAERIAKEDSRGDGLPWQLLNQWERGVRIRKIMDENSSAKTAQQIADEMLANHQAGRAEKEARELGELSSALAIDHAKKANEQAGRYYVQAAMIGPGCKPSTAHPIHIEGLDLIAARTKTHGHFDHVAHFTDTVKLAMRGTPNWHPTLNAAQREALDCIAMKLGRILAGDPNHPDHIDDVIGYATLFKEWSGR